MLLALKPLDDNAGKFLTISIALILIINIISRISKEMTTTLFYFIILPAILIMSVIKLLLRKLQP